MIGKIKCIGIIILILIFAGCVLEETEYTVTFDANGGTGQIPDEQRVRAGNRFQLPSGNGLFKSGYNFKGWSYYSDSKTSYSAGFFYTPEWHTTLYANWVDENYIIPTDVLRREFTTSGNHSFMFNEGFPAIVEIYALGAGGGGQGGHSNVESNIIPPYPTIRGTGGAGGGGAASYIKFSIDRQVAFNITVGRGGTGGSGVSRSITSSWASGTPGGNGGNTLVSISVGTVTTTLTVRGGTGGGGEGNALTRGSGGATGVPPVGLTLIEWDAKGGFNGNAGVYKGDIRGTNHGGKAAEITKGSIISFGNGPGATIGKSAQTGGGGRGGYGASESGTNGGHGHVIIIITYPEE